MTRMLCLVAMSILLFGIAREANARERLLPRLFLRPCRPVEELPLPAAQPMAIPSRNMVNLVDRNLPTSWSVEEGKFKNIKWSADLGS